MHNLTLITMTVTPFVGIGRFSIIYSNNHTRYRQLKEFDDYFYQNIIPLIQNKSSK